MHEVPKVGIRPVIDGRYGGVRESLERVTMEMARSASSLIGEKLRHPSGEAVQTLLPDTCIGGFAEAAQVSEEFARNGVGLSLTVTPCWCYGAETMDDDPWRPKAIWGFNGTDRPGAVYLAATLAGHAQKGLPCFGIYGRDVQDLGDGTIPEDVGSRILQFVRAGLAVGTMRGKSYLAMGGPSMGIAGSMVDPSFFEKWLGMRVESIDMSEFLGRMRTRLYDPAEFERARAWVAEHCQEGNDPNPPEKRRTRAQKAEDWDVSVKMALIARDLMRGNDHLAELGYPEQSRGHNAIAAGFQGQRQWTDYFPNGDFMEAILCSSFDWNGVRQPYVLATENDSLNGASMLMGHLLTGTAQLFADVRTYWSPEAVLRVAGHRLEGAAEGGVLHLINSGPAALDWTGRQSVEGRPACKPHWAIQEAEVSACLAATRWCASDLGYFPGGGWSTDFTTEGGMPCTMFRLNLVQGLGPVLQIAEGETVSLPESVHDLLDKRTNPSWPTTWFAPRLTGRGAFHNVYSVMSHWGANHAAISYGHIGSELATLASMLRIPVDMHNLGPERIFRPAVWARFGTESSESADYRACANFGSLY